MEGITWSMNNRPGGSAGQLDGSDRPTRSAQIISLIDRVRRDPAFRARHMHAPEEAATQLGVYLSDAERAGLRGLVDP